jgi:hypothetical protein
MRRLFEAFGYRSFAEVFGVLYIVTSHANAAMITQFALVLPLAGF